MDLKKIKDYADIHISLQRELLREDDFRFLPEDQIKKMLAFHKIKNIEKLLNGNWKADFNDNNQRKWYPYFEKTSGGWRVGSCHFHDGDSVGQVAFYETEEKARFAGTKFLNIYIDLID